MILSASVADNAEVFAQILELHVPRPAVIADVTYGRGRFWAQVNLADYDLRATDLATGTDCTKLPYETASIDAVVLDPPYVAGFFRPRQMGEGYGDFTDRYSKGTTASVPKRYHEGVLDLFERAGNEAARVLRDDGVLIVKCQDEVHAGRQYLTHAEILRMYEPAFFAKDLFVVVRVGGNFAARGRAKSAKQVHARKNHSYFLVFTRRVRSE